MLEIDLVHADNLGPAVEWPPSPPTRQHHTAPRRAAAGEGDAEVSHLTTARAVRMLDASIAHLRTALETAPDDTTADRIEHALGQVDEARNQLTALVGADRLIDLAD